MRRRALRMIRRAGLIAPTLVAMAAHAQSIGPAAKDSRDREIAPAAARLSPDPGDVAPADPVGAAFDLFPSRRAATPPPPKVEATRSEPAQPPPAAIAEVEPGVVAVERPAVPVAVPNIPVAPAVAAMAGDAMAAYAPTTMSSQPTDRVFVGAPTAQALAGAFVPRPMNVPLPRRRPADGGTEAAAEPTLRLASLEPEPVRGPTPEAAPIAAEGVFGEPKKIPRAAEPYMALLRREAAANKVPLWLAVGVGWVESKYQPNLRGTHGVVGLMQVMPSTARYQGYKGPTEKLLDPETNIVWGMRELGWTWKEAKGDACLAIAKYKGGIRTKRISPAAADYCRKAKTVTGMG
ncbi:transglycosylase SLT domain-containing protein [Pinisolibacter sp.]|uniref:transglycosylase SLT domain-containing protein n=1 Tax=Pinisolibacter sp. TaxID=2172024 RepID=UPI002FDD6346